MNTNQELIYTFYNSFQKKDYTTIQECYADGAIFNDPIFKNLNAEQVRAMWGMFCAIAKDLRIEFKNISADETSARAQWTAFYTFPATGKKVVNYITASFLLERGKIVRHTDSFDFYRWARQSLGIAGFLFGQTALMKNIVRKAAVRNLNNYMNKKRNGGASIF